MTEAERTTTDAVFVAPTLATMAHIYTLSREGGPKSERFQAYVALTPTQYGLVPYNPMAGDSALEAVQQLLNMRAEALVQESAAQTMARCEYTTPITLALAVRSRGMWTDRVTTEVDERVTGKIRNLHRGIVNVWSREDVSAGDVRRESAAETVRIMWHATHGVADTLLRVLACEGLAYALAPASDGFRPSAPLEAKARLAVVEAMEVLGDSRQASEIAAVLFGDDLAAELGYAPLGLPPYAGYQWAVHRATEALADHTAAQVLRMSTPEAERKPSR